MQFEVQTSRVAFPRAILLYSGCSGSQVDPYTCHLMCHHYTGVLGPNLEASANLNRCTVIGVEYLMLRDVVWDKIGLSGGDLHPAP